MTSMLPLWNVRFSGSGCTVYPVLTSKRDERYPEKQRHRRGRERRQNKKRKNQTERQPGRKTDIHRYWTRKETSREKNKPKPHREKNTHIETHTHRMAKRK